MTKTVLEARGLTMTTPSGRVLFQDLCLSLGTERVALIGRNGVGKSTLLDILAGQRKPQKGQVLQRVTPYLVSQLQDSRSRLSQGELRRQRLAAARLAEPAMLLLDEPTQDLDQEGIAWLRDWLSAFRGGLMVASHDSSLLQDFQHFFWLAESGCRLFSGSLSELEDELERDRKAREVDYLRKLHRLAENESHTDHVARRRARKKRYGRVREIDRATSRCTLNQKRDAAQDNHGRDQREREARLEAVRQWTRAGRRALKVDLPLILPPPPPPSGATDIVVLREVTTACGPPEPLNLNLRHQRLAVTGPNGSGKTTLLDLLCGRGRPHRGSVRTDPARIGSITQGGTNWMLDDSLLALLHHCAESLVTHQFPLALANRPLATLSPGERVRAALICLFQGSPPIELLVLDEPTYSLDLLGKKALTQALKLWPGGLVVASHDQVFLSQIGVEPWLELRRPKHRSPRLGDEKL